MGKSGRHSGHSRPSSGSHRAENSGGDDDRTFGEIRKFLHDALRIASLHRWAFFVPFCLTSSIVFVSSLYSPRSYTASVRFEIRLDPVSEDLSSSRGAASFKTFMGTMTDDLKSEAHMTEVVENLGLTKDLPRDADGNLTEASVRRRASLARSMASRLQIWKNHIHSSGVTQVEITYTGPDSQIGSGLVDEVRKTYARRSKAWIKDFLAGQRDYHKRELEEAQAKLDRAKREEREFRLHNPYVDPVGFGTLGAKQVGLQAERRTLLLRRREHKADLTGNRKVLASIGDPEVMPMVTQANEGAEIIEPIRVSHASIRLTAEIRKIDIEIERLRSTRGMTHLHPQIVELRKTRQSLQDEFEQQRIIDASGAVANESIGRTSVPDPVSMPAPIQPWQIDRAQALVAISALEEKIKEIDRDLTANDEETAQLSAIKQNAFAKQDEFEAVVEQRQKAAANRSGRQGKLDLITPTLRAAEQDRLVHFADWAQARGSSMPIAPRAKNIVVLALLLACAAGAVCVVLAEVLDHVYRSGAHVAHSLGLPILEAIDEIVTAQDRRRQFVRRLVVAPMILSCGLGITLVTGSMAYLSLSRPATYERLMKAPRAALEFFAQGGEEDASHLITEA